MTGEPEGGGFGHEADGLRPSASYVMDGRASQLAAIRNA
jgi:hypothetical protein